MIDTEVDELMAALFDYDGELDLGEPNKRAAGMIVSAALTRRVSQAEIL